jgi:hypothetical protein
MLTYFAPLLAYLLSFPVMIITLFKVEIGIIYFVTLVPFVAVTKKIATFPQGNNFPDFLLVSIVLGWIFGAVRRGRVVFQPSPVNAVVFLFIFGSILNLITFYSANTFSSEANLYVLKQWKNYMILPILFFVGINCIEDEKVVRIMLIFIGLSLLGMCFNFHSTFKWLKTFHYSHDMRIAGPLKVLGPNEVGIFFAMMGFLIFTLSYYVEDKILKYFLIFVFLCCLYPVLYSYSRSAYLCILLGFLAVGLLKDRRLLLLPLCLVFLYSVLLPNSVVERIDMTFLDKFNASAEITETRSVEVGSVSIDTVNRKGLWQKALRHFQDNSLFGIGFGAFLEREGKITHSLFFKILAEQGLIGLFIFCVFTAVVLYQGYKLFRSSETMLGRGIGLAFLISNLLLLTGSLGGDISEYYNLMCVYWLFMGIVARYNSNNGRISSELSNA